MMGTSPQIDEKAMAGWQRRQAIEAKMQRAIEEKTGRPYASWDTNEVNQFSWLLGRAFEDFEKDA